MLIKAGLEYTRMGDLENNINSLIWIKIKLKNRDPILVCSGYRQWTLPKILGHPNSKRIKFQRQRFESYLESFSSALKMKLPVVIMHDVNIDISYNNIHNVQYNIKSLYDTYNEYLINNDISYMHYMEV